MFLGNANYKDKEHNRLMNEKPSRRHDEKIYIIQDYEAELRQFLYAYKGQKTAWDFIQYLLNLKHLKGWNKQR